MKFRQMKSNSTYMKIFAAGAAAGALSLGAVATLGLTANAQAPRLLSPPLSSDGTLSFADLVEEVTPSVVSILVEREIESREVPPQLEQFFRFGQRGGPDGGPSDRRGDRFNDGPQTMEAQGSGFFIDGEGHIVTNNHVIEDATRVRVRLNNGDELSAEIVGADPDTDLAVLKVDSKKPYPFVQFAEDVNLRVGDWVVAVGNPFGLSGTVTSGIVSAIGREGGQFTDFVQIDAPINRGNSGGPTFDLKGRVVGVNTSIFSTNGGSVGIGFAIPAKVANSITRQLIENGSVTRGWLGVSIQELTTELAAAMNRKDTDGALVAEVLAGTPAAKAGFVDGDLVLTLNGKAIKDPTDLTRSISALQPGEKAKIKVLRDGKEKVLNVTLGQRDAEQLASANDNDDGGSSDVLSEDLGLRVSELDNSLRDQFGIPNGVDGVLVTGVRSGSAAEDAGLRNGVVILEVNGDKITNAASLRTKIGKAKSDGRDAVLLRMQLGEAKQFGALPLKAGN